jgi:hypothetical protein
MSRFVKNSATVDATQTLVVVENDTIRPAAFRGGYSSRTGLTMVPMWVEEGAQTLLRKREFLSAVLAGEYQGIPWYFEGHGAEGWQAVKVAYLDGLKAALAEWDAFRRQGGPVPSATSEEGRLARSYTLHGMMEGCYLTDHEATELLPRWSTWAEMEEDEEDEDGIAARVWASRGHAWTADTKEGVWNFVPEGETSTWTDAEGWTYRSTLSVQDKAWIGQRTRKTEVGWEVQRCLDMAEDWQWEDC